MVIRPKYNNSFVRKEMREDHLELLEKMYPDGFIMVYVQGGRCKTAASNYAKHGILTFFVTLIKGVGILIEQSFRDGYNACKRSEA